MQVMRTVADIYSQPVVFKQLTQLQNSNILKQVFAITYTNYAREFKYCHTQPYL